MMMKMRKGYINVDFKREGYSVGTENICSLVVRNKDTLIPTPSIKG